MQEAPQQPTYVPKLHQIPIGIWNEVEDEQYTKQPDEPMAEFDAEVPIRSGKDSEAALMVLTKRRAEIRDARSVSSLRLLFTVYELAFRNGGIEESNVGKKTRKWERFPMLK
ncbi:hypothetical protein HO173_013178 [Letharia columbiana]|uniref:Uncharacterized protein n=1 Tax=Letharia columbiana TaxID=112416 RepID=A0A8H6CIL8_9LECA|nr:uncharacterized protein HO173_013178 [Letharia columbiana]KAF6223846.1 hypothetical protein HO173_013178 [Letharia columbiana]